MCLLSYAWAYTTGDGTYPPSAAYLSRDRSLNNRVMNSHRQAKLQVWQYTQKHNHTAGIVVCCIVMSAQHPC